MAESGPNSEVVPVGALEIGADSWEVGFVPWLGSLAASGAARLRGRRRGSGWGVGTGVGVGMNSVVREEAVIRAGARGFGLALVTGRGAGARSGSPRIHFGVCTTPVATQRAPAPAPLTQKPMIAAIVESRPPPPDVAM